MRNRIKNLINELNTILNWGEINGSLLETLYYKYSVMSGGLFVEMAELLEDIIKYESDFLEVKVYGYETTYDIYDMLKDNIRYNIVDISCFEDDICRLLDKCEKELKRYEEEVLSQDTTKKQVILINSKEDCIKVSRSKHKRSLKNRFIVEKDCDPEKAGRFDYLCGFYTDDYEITIAPVTHDWKPTGKYELRIYRKDTQYCKSPALQTADEVEHEQNLLWAELTEAHTAAVYSCYTKAREALFELVREYENCDIYGYMRYPETGRTFSSNNAKLISKLDLHKIS